MHLKEHKDFVDKYIQLCLGKDLNEEDKEYLLGSALILLKVFDGDDDKREYFELAYNIILNYSLKTKDFLPLNDMAYNYGFFPIVRYINRKHLLDEVSINEILFDFSLEKYKYNTYIETFEQYKTRKRILESNSTICFIAPTSSGKSSIISEHIKRNFNIKKSIIIVPTKSLLSQTYMEIRRNIIDRKVICHDEMYKEEDCFVGILTQERTMRLLENNAGLKVDYLYIDEAHNLFNNDSRNILLARVIRICRYNNPNLKIIYLSPFINDVNNLLLKDKDFFDNINEQRISYSIKEPTIYELRKDGSVFLYNRFLNIFTDLKTKNTLFSYIMETQKEKNFFFIGSPRKIEIFAQELFENTEPIELTAELRELQKTIEKNVHASFKIIKMIEHGIIYLHAKIPDVLKDYLEYQFKIIPEIKYLVANTVILEGINLPIDNLYILDARKHNGSSLLNLIGRVNRLNDVFDIRNGDLEKLLPSIHFINSSYYHGKMENKIKILYAERMDKVINPLLLNYDINKLNETPAKKDELNKKNLDILEREKIFFEEPVDEISKLKKLLMKCGVEQLVAFTDKNINTIYKKITSYIDNNEQSDAVIDVVREILVVDIDVIDDSFKRLKNEAAIRYYKRFINVSRRENLSDQIESQLEFFRGQCKSGHYFMYIGRGFGECKGPYVDNVDKGKVYVDLRTKSDNQIVNLLIIKTKIEQEFLSYQYMRAVNFLHEVDLISTEKYNMEIYGTNDENKIELLKLGLTPGLLKILSDNNQIVNIAKDQYGNIQGNYKIKEFYDRSDEYTKFELRRHLKFAD